MRSETFTLLAMCCWFNVLNCQSATARRWPAAAGLIHWLAGGLALSIALQIAVLQVPGSARLSMRSRCRPDAAAAGPRLPARCCGWRSCKRKLRGDGAGTCGGDGMSPTLALQFLLCAAVIMVAGVTLSRSADRLAELHGWGRGWVELALLATVTSLPELASHQRGDHRAGPWRSGGRQCAGRLRGQSGLPGGGRPVAPSGADVSAGRLDPSAVGGLRRADAGAGGRQPGTGRAGSGAVACRPEQPRAAAALSALALRSVFEHERGQAQTQVRGRPSAIRRHAPDPTDQRTVRQEWMRFGMAALAVLAVGSCQ